MPNPHHTWPTAKLCRLYNTYVNLALNSNAPAHDRDHHIEAAALLHSEMIRRLIDPRSSEQQKAMELLDAIGTWTSGSRTPKGGNTHD